MGKDIIDLVPDDEGIYGPKDIQIKPKIRKKKEYKSNNVDEFFEGIDVGLDFVEGMQKRVKRMMGLKG